MKWSTNGFNKGETVEIFMDTGNGTKYKVSAAGKTGWVSGGSVSIPPDFETNPNKMTKEEIELYANTKNFTSDTRYYIWIDLDRQVLNVLDKSDDIWILVKSIPCATGKNVTPTIRGTFKVQDRGLRFGSSLGAKNWVRIDGNYLMHSLPIYSNGSVADWTLGKRASHGCVRMSMEDSKWIYDNIPTETTV